MPLVGPTSRRRLLPLFAAPLAAALALPTDGGMLAAQIPADDSADAGFARDMSVHHSQAVEMALIALGQTDDPEIRALATDIVLTQQAQIGMMRGWLDVWGLPPTGIGPRMAWMGHATEGLMPGMATPDEIAGLRELPPAETDRRFLELMIRHHEGGVAMAQAGLDLGQQPVVRRLAEAILTSQRYEIEAMRAILGRLGAPDATPAATPAMAR